MNIAHKLAAGGELERTGGRALTYLWRQFGFDHWQPTSKDPVMNMTGSQRNSLWIHCTFLSRIYGLFRSAFLEALGIWFDCTSHRWHGNSQVSYWCRSIWDLHFHECLMLFHMAAGDISAFDSWGVLKKCCTEKPLKARVVYLPRYILIQSIYLYSHLVKNENGTDGCRAITKKEIECSQTNTWQV